jgi:hypothetical protein
MKSLLTRRREDADEREAVGVVRHWGAALGSELH